MIDKDKLADMCSLIYPQNAYFRPFICKGEVDNGKIFLVGTNPATPIYPDDINIDNYIRLLSNYNDFMDFYINNRRTNNKSEISRTRQGINSFVDWLSSISNKSIIETDIITYPTPSIKELKKEPRIVLNKGKENFFNILYIFKPQIIILYGKKTVKLFIEGTREYNIRLHNTINPKDPIEEYEKTIPLTSFSYKDNTVCKTFACRHFMYYGKIGDSFFDFKSQLLNHIRN